jgi:ferredoxin
MLAKSAQVVIFGRSSLLPFRQHGQKTMRASANILLSHKQQYTAEYRLPVMYITRRSMMARSSEPSDVTPVDKAITFVISVGYDPAHAKDIVAALVEAGLSGEQLLATARQMAGRWEVGEDQGLEALAASVKAAKAETEGRAQVHVTVVPPNAWKSSEEDMNEEISEADMSKAFPVVAVEGTSLADVARFGIGQGASTLGEYIECACSGIMACSTCHVIVEPGKWFDKVGAPSEDEQDMLDLAYGARETSRLGCQIVLTKDLDGLVVRIPSGANNIMDHIPFKD